MLERWPRKIRMMTDKILLFLLNENQINLVATVVPAEVHHHLLVYNILMSLYKVGKIKVTSTSIPVMRHKMKPLIFNIISCTLCRPPLLIWVSREILRAGSWVLYPRIWLEFIRVNKASLVTLIWLFLKLTFSIRWKWSHGDSSRIRWLILIWVESKPNICLIQDLIVNHHRSRPIEIRLDS